jgi:hypothetical protein
MVLVAQELLAGQEVSPQNHWTTTRARPPLPLTLYIEITASLAVQVLAGKLPRVAAVVAAAASAAAVVVTAVVAVADQAALSQVRF